MELNKYSLRDDALANLYRSAFYLAKGNSKIGMDFLKKAKRVLGNDLKTPNTSLPRLVLAEKVLDQYHLLKSSIL